MPVKKIYFHHLAKPFYLPARTHLKIFISNLFKREGFKVESINYIFCSDAYLLRLNQKHLLHDTYTDIITFQFSSPSEPILSDIYISIDRVRENAKLFNTSFSKELHRVIFHGALHLCNYKDKKKNQSLQMREKEEAYLHVYFVSRETNPV